MLSSSTFSSGRPGSGGSSRACTWWTYALSLWVNGGISLFCFVCCIVSCSVRQWAVFPSTGGGGLGTIRVGLFRSWSSTTLSMSTTDLGDLMDTVCDADSSIVSAFRATAAFVVLATIVFGCITLLNAALYLDIFANELKNRIRMYCTALFVVAIVCLSFAIAIWFGVLSGTVCFGNVIMPEQLLFAGTNLAITALCFGVLGLLTNAFAPPAALPTEDGYSNISPPPVVSPTPVSGFSYASPGFIQSPPSSVPGQSISPVVTNSSTTFQRVPPSSAPSDTSPSGVYSPYQDSSV